MKQICHQLALMMLAFAAFLIALCAGRPEYLLDAEGLEVFLAHSGVLSQSSEGVMSDVIWSRDGIQSATQFPLAVLVARSLQALYVDTPGRALLGLLQAVIAGLGVYGITATINRRSCSRMGPRTSPVGVVVEDPGLGIVAVATLAAGVVYALLTYPLWFIGLPWSILLLPLLINVLSYRTWIRQLLVPLFLAVWSQLGWGAVCCGLAVLVLSLLEALLRGQRREALQRCALIVTSILTITALVSYLDPQQGFVDTLIAQIESARLLVANESMRQLTGWVTPNYHRYPLLALGIVAALGLVLLNASRVALRDQSPVSGGVSPLFFTGSLLLSLFSLKMQPLFAASVSSLACCYVLSFGGSSGDGGRHRSSSGLLCNRWAAQLGGPLSLLVLILFMGGATKLGSGAWEDRKGVLRSATLMGPLFQLRADYAKSNKQLRLLNEPSLAGELIYLGLPVFLDKRIDPSEDQTVTGSIVGDYREVVGFTSRWQKVIDHWRFNAAVLRTDSSLANVLIQRLGWRAVAKTAPIMVTSLGRTTDHGLSLLVPPGP